MTDFLCTVKKVDGREILDSRGNPTVEATVELESGVTGRGAAPGGASTGSYEAAELRDGDAARFSGKGVREAVSNIRNLISPALSGLSIYDQAAIDRILCELGGTPRKTRLGANATVAVSLACAQAAAESCGMPLYRYVGGISATRLPVPMMNILNGGAHSSNNLDIQEFMIVPLGASGYAEGLRMGCEIYHALKKILLQRKLPVSVGDEGGFAPDLPGAESAIGLILEAAAQAGYRCARDGDFMLALDAAASEWQLPQSGAGDAPASAAGSAPSYRLPKSGRLFSSQQLTEYWRSLIDRYPIYSLEDPLGEDDLAGWRALTEAAGDRVLLVGDDLFVTDPARLKAGAAAKAGNAILIKPNQIGTLSETIETVITAKSLGYKAILSHRSGETEDTAVADLAVALNTGLIKTGAPARGERTAKYNRLLRIADSL